MSDRELVLDTVKSMPDTASLHEIVDELLLVAEVRKRLEQNPAGKGVPADELLQQVSSWITK
jgi:predicted transcriptional regulator